MKGASKFGILAGVNARSRQCHEIRESHGAAERVFRLVNYKRDSVRSNLYNEIDILKGIGHCDSHLHSWMV